MSYRCLQTAEPISSALGVPIYVEHGERASLPSPHCSTPTHPPAPGLAEWFSPVVPGTGLHPRPGSAASLQQHVPAIDPAWSSVWYVPRRGEDVPQIHDRTDAFLDVFAAEIERRFPATHERVLLVSHAATVIALVRGLLGDRALPVRVGCCSLSEFERIPDARSMLGGWKALRVADGSHLKDGASRDWGFEDIEIAGGKVRRGGAPVLQLLMSFKVVEDPGVPGSELLDKKDEPVGSQVHVSSNL
ncbi:hypothetical protein C0993_007588 [Termitomyces sp. T159_Od127]|nr:hypothetical protein C0993_007588 [Termitomyces sp. T159_Od127]